MADVAQREVIGSQAQVEIRERLLREVDSLTIANTAQPKGNGRAEARIAEIRSAVLASNPGLRQGALAAGTFTVARSQRNPTALFGLGLIDAIPDAAIEAVAKREAKRTPETQGRISRLKDGRIGRLGWKAQTANVEDFVLNACAVELGLEVPGHHQAISPQAPKYRTTGLDLTAGECNALVAYVRSLPKPARAPAIEPPRKRNISLPEKPCLRVWAVRTATRPRWVTSMGFTATCCSTIWVRRWPTRVLTPTTARMTEMTNLWPRCSIPVVSPAVGRPSLRPSKRERVQPGRNGERHPSGASATPVRISTTVELKLLSRPSRCTAARAQPRRTSSSSFRPENVSRWRHSSSPWSPHHPLGLPSVATEGRTEEDRGRVGCADLCSA